MQSYSAYLKDQDGNNVKTNRNASSGNGYDGFGFLMQDEVRSGKYVGYMWYGAATYNSNFANFEAQAKAFYTHTYRSTTIHGISHGIAGEPGFVQVDLSIDDYSFVAQSGMLYI